MIRFARALVAIALAMVAAPAMAQGTWPEKPVKLVVGFTAGSATDVTARMFAQKFQEAFGQPFVVDNIAGNAGGIAVDRVAKAAPDGYTLMWSGNAAITILPSLQPMPFDPLKDLTPISTSLSMPSIMMVNNDLPLKSIAELVAYAKANPGKLSYGAGTSTAQVSGETFNRDGRRAWACVNFVTAHDGFTLNDVVTYNEKHNAANGEDNKDGSSDNRSWNCGAEGPTDDKEINALRARQIRNFLSTLLLSQGTPMLVAGDEFGRTQNGNNNAYCQDSEISWIDWSLADKNKDLLGFARKLAALRHKYPILRRTRFFTGEFNEELGVKDLTWINAGGGEMQPDEWDDGNMKCFGMLMDGRAQVTGIRKRGHNATLLLVINSYHDVVDFTLPEAADGEGWTLLADTNLPNREENPDFAIGAAYQVTGRSFLVFLLRAAAAGR